jgi:hemoglobin
LNEIFPIAPEHFGRWIEIFNQTIDRLFAGETTENAKIRAGMIAHSLNQRINPTEIQNLRPVKSV